MDLTPKQQTSEAIRQAETILITTGQRPTIDQVAAVMSLTAILRKFGKKVSAIITDPIPQQMNFLETASLDRSLSGMRDFILKVDVNKSEVDKLRYEVENGKLNIFITPFKGGFAPSDVTFDYGDFHYDLAIILGVPTRARIDRVFEENKSLFNAIPVVNLDFHRTNENYGAVNLIEPTASSLCEILVATSESLQTGLIDADIATIMLTGLMASTDRFTASHTTSKSLTVAAQMMAAGARQQTVVRGLYRDNRPERADRPERSDRDRTDRNRPDARPERQASAGPFPSTRPAQSSQPQPEAQPRPQEQPAVKDPDVHADTPDVPRPAADPIIEPGHIEMSRTDDGSLPVSDQMAMDVPPMADFAAAAEILRDRGPRTDNQTPTSEA